MSTITKEFAQDIIKGHGYGVAPSAVEALARMALAAMDSKPVALQPELAKVIYHFRDWNEGFPVERFKADYVISWMLANYPPAQPTPVVPEEVTDEDCPALVKYDVTEVDEAWARGFNACRSAMLQASPVCTCPSGDGSLRWPCPVHPGNSPVIGIDLASGPDRTVEVRYVAPPGYVVVPKEPTRQMLDEFDSIIDYGAEDSQDAWRRLLAAAPHEAINALIPLVSRDEQEGK
ncbi:hypothetical protein [Klebsiella michiganensis]|uniref:hypothetical protein n=1 Tax=Klebsiella michiganensis TaxID=1134687 RepID=UPI000AEEA24E|nr:hypothetical protein [Klebsiella michiganensis]